MELAEEIREQLFLDKPNSINPYLEYIEDKIEEINNIQSFSDEYSEKFQRGNLVFELRKLFEADKAEELLLKINGEIYDESFYEELD